MLYIIIFIVACAIGIIAGYAASKKNIDDSVNGYLHIIHDRGEPEPYIFLELKSNAEISKINNSSYVLLKTIRE